MRNWAIEKYHAAEKMAQARLCRVNSYLVRIGCFKLIRARDSKLKGLTVWTTKARRQNPRMASPKKRRWRENSEGSMANLTINKLQRVSTRLKDRKQTFGS